MRRLAFDVDDKFFEEFNILVRDTGASSKADAFRKAVAVYKLAVESQKKGEKLMVADSDRNPISEIIIA